MFKNLKLAVGMLLIVALGACGMTATERAAKNAETVTAHGAMASQGMSEADRLSAWVQNCPFGMASLGTGVDKYVTTNGVTQSTYKNANTGLTTGFGSSAVGSCD